MTTLPRPMHRPFVGCRSSVGMVLALAMVAAGVSVPGTGNVAAAAQASSPCALLKTDDVQSLAPNEQIAAGASITLEGTSTCRFSWGAGPGRFKLDVVVGEASRMFSGMGSDLIKQGLQSSVAAGTADAIIPDVGDAAVFKADSSFYVYSTAYVKGRVLQVRLDGPDARDRKDQVIALLKSAASRL